MALLQIAGASMSDGSMILPPWRDEPEMKFASPTLHSAAGALIGGMVHEARPHGQLRRELVAVLKRRHPQLYAEARRQIHELLDGRGR